jgi:hypothetical protein
MPIITTVLLQPQHSPSPSRERPDRIRTGFRRSCSFPAFNGVIFTGNAIYIRPGNARRGLNAPRPKADGRLVQAEE